MRRPPLSRWSWGLLRIGLHPWSSSLVCAAVSRVVQMVTRRICTDPRLRRGQRGIADGQIGHEENGGVRYRVSRKSMYDADALGGHQPIRAWRLDFAVYDRLGDRQRCYGAHVQTARPLTFEELYLVVAISYWIESLTSSR